MTKKENTSAFPPKRLGVQVKTPRRFPKTIRSFPERINSFRIFLLFRLNLSIYQLRRWQELHEGGRTPAIRFSLWCKQLTSGGRSARSLG